jgi:hypothetical protein
LAGEQRQPGREVVTFERSQSPQITFEYEQPEVAEHIVDLVI